jgi:membrane-associated protein
VDQLIELFKQAVDIFLHLDQHLVEWTNVLGGWLYLLLFAIIFAETGLVVTPFLPGDSLLFAVGALTALEGAPINLPAINVLLIIAAVIGDAVNYSIGYRVGAKVFTSETSRWLNKKHLLKAQAFYERYGGKTIIFARFIPIIRTFAPFVAGIGKMTYRRFFMFNVVGAIAWVVLFTFAGYFFGNIPTNAVSTMLTAFWVIIAATTGAPSRVRRQESFLSSQLARKPITNIVAMMKNEPASATPRGTMSVIAAAQVNASAATGINSMTPPMPERAAFPAEVLSSLLCTSLTQSAGVLGSARSPRA